jgi:hypothetical protein
MSYLTRKHDTKTAKLDKKNADDTALLGRALKAVGLGLNASPAAQISALEKYIERLRVLKLELTDDYGLEELRDALWRVDIEITKAVAQIAGHKIDQIKPDK